MNKTQSNRRLSIIERIESRCEIVDLGFVINGKPSPCHIWQGGDSGKGDGAGRGYGRVSISGQTCAVHRVIATHFFGYIPLKKHVDHKCNSRLCCNPDHLEIVSSKENQRRRVERANAKKN